MSPMEFAGIFEENFP